MNFSLMGRYSRYGSWGALEYMNETSSPKYDAIADYSKNASCWYPGCNVTDADYKYTAPVIVPPVVVVPPPPIIVST